MACQSFQDFDIEHRKTFTYNIKCLNFKCRTNCRLRFKCKSTLPSDLCCLYTGTCEGDADPLSAALTDDGLELVAARKSTADMQQFLKRAAAKHPDYRDLNLLDKNMKWAAYFAWDNAPLGRSLEEVLQETKMFLTSLDHHVAKFTTTTTTLAVVQGPTLAAGQECFEKSARSPDTTHSAHMPSVYPKYRIIQFTYIYIYKCLYTYILLLLCHCYYIFLMSFDVGSIDLT